MKQIIALGGGGFSMEPENPLLDLYILHQSTQSSPKICFIGTASGDAENYINRFYESFNKQNCQPTHLSLFKPPVKDIRSFVMEQDIIYVGGGSTKNLIALWKEWELDQILKEAYHNGVILSGISAGSLCWYEDGITDSYGDILEPIHGIGLIKGSHSPHYDGESNRRASFHHFIKEAVIQPGIGADDGVGLHYIDGQLVKIVSSRRPAKAYEVTLKDKQICEKELETIYLGTS